MAAPVRVCAFGTVLYKSLILNNYIQTTHCSSATWGAASAHMAALLRPHSGTFRYGHQATILCRFVKLHAIISLSI